MTSACWRAFDRNGPSDNGLQRQVARATGRKPVSLIPLSGTSMVSKSGVRPDRFPRRCVLDLAIRGEPVPKWQRGEFRPDRGASTRHLRRLRHRRARLPLHQIQGPVQQSPPSCLAGHRSPSGQDLRSPCSPRPARPRRRRADRCHVDLLAVPVLVVPTVCGGGNRHVALFVRGGQGRVLGGRAAPPKLIERISSRFPIHQSMPQTTQLDRPTPPSPSPFTPQKFASGATPTTSVSLSTAATIPAAQTAGFPSFGPRRPTPTPESRPTATVMGLPELDTRKAWQGWWSAARPVPRRGRPQRQ